MFRRFLWVTLLLTISAAAVTDEYLAALTTGPFNKLKVSTGTYKETDPPAEATLCNAHKWGAICRIIDAHMLHLKAQADTHTDILEVGTGSGYMTGQLLHHIYQQRQAGTTSYSSTTLYTVDDYRPRTAEFGVRGTINIPARIAFGATPTGSEKTPEEEYQEMLSRLVKKEVDEGLSPGALLSLVTIPRRTRTASATYLFTGPNDAGHVSTPQQDDLFSTSINELGVNTLTEMATTFHGAQRFGLIWIDVDPTSADEMYKTLCASWDVLSPHGALVIDDYSWSHEQLGGMYVRDGVLQFFNTHKTLINASFSALADISTDAPCAVYDDYAGYAQGGLSATIGVDAVLTYGKPVIEFHHLWSGRGRWITVIRRGNTSSLDINLDIPLDVIP